ncbi:MAG: efflux RND transporter periplasmic adaptor subunit [Patescibacteria group bacterium]|nr:MAG: efflux RND transporter periplasmic adaptor subunit [Patescibacteria group bacterium]
MTLPKLNWKRLATYGGVVIGAVLVIGVFAKRGPKIEYDTHTVERGTLRQTVQVTGEVVSSTDVDLKFEGSGRVRSIDVSVGDAVKTNAILATLDDRNERVRVQSAQASLQSAQANLDRLVNGATPEDVRVAEVAVSNAEIALEQARQALADTNVSNAASLQKAHADMDGQIETLFLKASTVMQVLRSDVFDGIGNLRADFWTTNTMLATQTALNYGYARNDFAKMEADLAAYRLANRAGKDALLAALLLEAKSVRQAAQTATDLMQISTPNSQTTQAAFDTRKANVRAAWVDMNSAVNASESQRQLVASIIASNSAALNAAEQNVRTYEGALESAKASLALKKAPATSYDLAAARASVTQASAALGEASIALDRTRIRAPYDGTIAAVLGRIGSTVTSNEVILKLHGNDVYEIEADVPETDIAKLRVGMEAEMTLDAYGDDVIFAGELATIDTAQTVIQDVVYYKTRFRFVGNGHSVRAGMTASVTVVTIERPEALIVPQRSVREDDDGKKYVRILEDGAEKRLDVQLGTRGDNGLVEVLEGLAGGEEVILSIRENGQVKR